MCFLIFYIFVNFRRVTILLFLFFIILFSLHILIVNGVLDFFVVIMFASILAFYILIILVIFSFFVSFLSIKRIVLLSTIIVILSVNIPIF